MKLKFICLIFSTNPRWIFTKCKERSPKSWGYLKGSVSQLVTARGQVRSQNLETCDSSTSGMGNNFVIPSSTQKYYFPSTYFEIGPEASWKTLTIWMVFFSLTTCLIFFPFLWTRHQPFILSLPPGILVESKQTIISSRHQFPRHLF